MKQLPMSNGLAAQEAVLVSITGPHVKETKVRIDVTNSILFHGPNKIGKKR